eukprot:CAMPEP_0174890698 /NCGR_PEP_ID=MMETSP0167-20121228/5797_1 /TAXON_ID=38298 /ORGANISM="Rhodella maculata, Strain CCMP736" /LENGTH=83 /DNA_ID=CAMNT_0016128575 /DNA_START=596 /DNA_END=847 /DNA_ORIENTATION=-
MRSRKLPRPVSNFAKSSAVASKFSKSSFSRFGSKKSPPTQTYGSASGPRKSDFFSAGQTREITQKSATGVWTSMDKSIRLSYK